MSLESHKENYWNVYPQYTSAGLTKQLYDNDKSSKKAASSKLMWTVAFYSDRKSIYFNLPEDEKISLLLEDVYGDVSKKDDKKFMADFMSLVSYYRSLNETVAQRALRGIEEKLLERDNFIRSTEYTLGERGERGFVWGTAEELDKMMANTTKIWDLYNKAKKMVDEEQETRTLGGASKSLSDSGDI